MAVRHVLVESNAARQVCVSPTAPAQLDIIRLTRMMTKMSAAINQGLTLMTD